MPHAKRTCLLLSRECGESAIFTGLGPLFRGSTNESAQGRQPSVGYP